MGDKYTFQTGDTVRLTSGGPRMVVQRPASGPATEDFLTDQTPCVWFNGLTLHREDFSGPCLSLVLRGEAASTIRSYDEVRADRDLAAA